MAQRGKGHERSLARARAKREEERRETARRRRFIGLAVLLVAVVGLAGVVLAMTRGGGDGTDQFASDGGGATEEVADPPTPAETGPGQSEAAAATLPPGCEEATPAGDDAPQFDAPPDTVIDPSMDYRATVATSCGTFTIDLTTDRAPDTVNNFVFLARQDYYDGIVFHRIVPDFVIQGGDPTGTGSGGPGYQFEDELELPEEQGYDTGTVAMANSGPDTNGSQFFVVLPGGGPKLEPLYSIFGQVTEGMDVVERIASVPLNGQSPVQPVVIEDVTIEEMDASS